MLLRAISTASANCYCYCYCPSIDAKFIAIDDLVSFREHLLDYMTTSLVTTTCEYHSLASSCSRRCAAHFAMSDLIEV